MNHLRHPLIALVLLAAMLACVLPGQPMQSAPVTTPVNIETAVAGTAQAAAQQTEQAKPATVTATADLSEASAPPEVLSTYGTSLVKLGNGSTQLKDYKAGMQIIFPPNWLTVRTGEPEYYKAWEKEGAQNQVLFEALTRMQSDDQNTFRATAFDMHPEHFLYGGFPRAEIVYAQGDTRTLKQLEADEKYRGAHSILAGYKFLLADYKEIAGGVQVLDFQYQWDSADHQGNQHTGFYREVMFKVPTGTVAIQMYIFSDQKEALLLEHDQIIGSTTFFNP